MIHEVRVRGLGVLADVTVPLRPGLNVLTGETGAGKTLLVTSLALLTGSRSDARLVAEGAPEAVVEAVATPGARTKIELSARGLATDEDLTIVRRLSADGGSRAWLAGQLTPIGSLADVGRTLVEILGQGDSFALARPPVQLEALDAFADATESRAYFAAALARVREITRELDAIRAAERERARTADALSFQAQEIERARLDPAEDDLLPADIARLEHAEHLRDLASRAAALAGAEGAAAALGEAQKLLEQAASIDPGLGSLASRIASAAAEAGEAASEARSWAEDLDADPARLESLRERAALIGRLKGRYGSTIEEVVAFGASARARLDELAGAGDRAAELDALLPGAREALDRTAAALTADRTTGALELVSRVMDELPSLALGGARFEVSCEPADETETGRDRVEFRFSAGGSREPVALARAASGGELSRLMIAVTLALASAHEIPVLVLDEADQGVGGQAALELARRMQRLGRTHQVLVVTHLAQVAAFADHHVSVRREDADVRVEVLDADGRVAELSRMLAGLEGSERARAHARELLDLAAAPEPARRRSRASSGTSR